MAVFPSTCSFDNGLVSPIPTLPVDVRVIGPSVIPDVISGPIIRELEEFLLKNPTKLFPAALGIRPPFSGKITWF